MTKNAKNKKSIFGETIQYYVTDKCLQGCPHCASFKQVMIDMSPSIFRETIHSLKNQGVKRIELFANDPILHPQIDELIQILEQSGLNYAILTIGDSFKYPKVKKIFNHLLQKTTLDKSGFVFSVDYTLKSADKILKNGYNAYAFKAKSFWEMAPQLQIMNISVRINAVITKYNVNEVPKIIKQAAKMEFAASFCFIQTIRQDFEELFKKGLTAPLEKKFRTFLQKKYGILNTKEIDKVIKQTREIATDKDLKPFNIFRGTDRSEEAIPEKDLEILRKKLLKLKQNKKIGNNILPDENFINNLGKKNIGCINLLKQGVFPQLKVASSGRAQFCCDLNDPNTARYSIQELDNLNKQKEFLKILRENPHILICLYFNPCSFSVNYVRYGTKSRNKSAI